MYYIYHVIEKIISVAYRSEYNNILKKQVILLMITNGKKSHYLPATNLFALLQGNLSNHKEDFYCLNCFNSYTTKNKLKEHEEICNNHDSCRIEMPKWVDKILKSLKAPFAIYLDLECLLKKNNFVKIIIIITIIIIIIIISKNHIQKKRPNMSLLVGHCLRDVHLMEKKINLIFTEEKIILKNYVKN